MTLVAEVAPKARATGRDRSSGCVAAPAEADDQWWCDCSDRRRPHVHFPNWDANPKYSTIMSALVDVETGMELPGSRA